MIVLRAFIRTSQSWRQELDDTYWVTSTEEDRFRHAAFARQAMQREDGEAAAAIRVDRRRMATEVMIWAEDATGCLPISLLRWPSGVPISSAR